MCNCNQSAPPCILHLSDGDKRKYNLELLDVGWQWP